MASNPSAASTSTGGSSPSEYGVLVGVDGSSTSQHALRWAVTRAERYGAVQPMTVWNLPWWAHSSRVPPASEDFKNEAAERGATAVRSVSSDDVQSLILCKGQAGPSLVEAGAAANVIVLGTRGRSGLKDVMLGSVSSYVVAHSTTPVVVVPAGAPVDSEERTIMVGVDGSPNSVQALLWAIHNTSADVKIDVFHCWVYPTGATPEVGLKQRDTYENNARNTLDQTIERAKAVVKPNERRRLVGWLEYGDARGVLNERAGACDLLVLGARGRGGVAHLLLGSVTSALVHQPATTTVVVPSIRRRN